MATAFVFPGQGSQNVGMGKALAENFPQARAVYDEVNDTLNQNLSQLMFEGPEADLMLTANAQPAIMTASMAAVRVLQAEQGLNISQSAKFVAGHSLGEYSALAAAGALSLSDTARLLRIRGDAMQRAVPVGRGAMAAMIGVDFEAAQKLVADAREATQLVCQVANDNGGGQIVVSGAKEAVEKAIELAKERGIKRAVLLPVSAPFHCDLMRPAADAMANALAQTQMRAPDVPLVANVTAAPVSDPEIIRPLLVEQVTGAVRWSESVRFMYDAGVTHFVELGSGKVLTGLLKRIVSDARGQSIGLPTDIAAFHAE